MSYVLVIVESPAKCAKIEKYLGPGYKCIASFGHLQQLLSLKDIDISNNFKPHFKPESEFIPSETLQYYNTINSEMQEKLCTKHNALCVMYPPGGYISWHNNANASAYNLVFTWSETGDGYFKYIDGETKEEIVMQDVSGWQCKASYFGAYDEPAHKLVYHTASTDCWRITVSYIFNREELSLGIQEDVIEEIKSK